VVLLKLPPKRVIQRVERLRLLHRSACDEEDAKRSKVRVRVRVRVTKRPMVLLRK
jgi:hypothetical protein